MVWIFIRTFSGLSEDFLVTFSGHPEFGTDCLGLVLAFFVTSLLPQCGLNDLSLSDTPPLSWRAA